MKQHSSTTIVAAIALTAFVPRGARADIGDNEIGMNTHIPPDDVIDACVDLGVGWIRFDNNWLEHQPTSGTPTFQPYLDDAVIHAVDGGLDVYMTIAYGPSWASTGDTDGVSRNDVPAAGTYGAYTRAAVAHYRALGVTHYGLWNEVNLDSFWEGSASDYVTRIVAEGLTAIDEGCADAGHVDCVALGPELAHVGDYDVWLEDIIVAMDGLGLSFDIYSHHIYQGFPETGDYIWDGDRFFEALDTRRFVFTRRSFVDVLADTGHAAAGIPDREVWITETGDRCETPMDPAAQAKQATYYMRVIDEQLARPWYTNTFYYEILDSLDELDGYGITRRTSGPDDTWSDNFDLKDAFIALRDRIDSEPAFAEEPCLLQCCDGIDNDGDGAADMADAGCTSPDDDDESDDPAVPRATLEAVRHDAVVLDGSLDEWTDAPFVSLASPEDFVSPDHPATNAADISCAFAAMWSPTHLYLAVTVTDDVHDNDLPAGEIWLADGVQAAFDMANDGGTGYDGTNDFEYGWASTGSGDVSHRWEAPAGASAPACEVVTATTPSGVDYEIRIPASDLGVAVFAESASHGFTLLVNDADGEGREGWIEWTPGIGAFKDPSSFGLLSLVTVATPEPDDPADLPPDDLPDDPWPDPADDAGTDGETDPASDGATDPDADLPPDASGDEPGGDGGCGCSLVV